MTLKQSLEKTFLQWKEISGMEFCLLDEDLNTIVSTGDKKRPSAKKLEAFLQGNALEAANPSYHLVKILNGPAPLLLILQGKDALTPTVASLAACQVESLCEAYRERTDKNAYMQNLLLGNYTEVDLYNRAKQLRIPPEAPRVVFLVETKHSTGDGVLVTVKNIFSARTTDFITAMDDRRLIIIRELKNGEDKKDMEGVASLLVDMLNTEAMASVRVAYSDPAANLLELPGAYKEAITALEVGRIFHAQKNIFGYHRLGIGRLIHQLPLSVCQVFIGEVFQRDSLDSLDDETMLIIRTFFENNLNLSETARKLYVHRNTLVYRFEKLEKKFGLDIRTFEDALTFKIAMMVSDYLTFHKTAPSQ